jgi:DNA-binding CsgD family transcriptional regulator
VLSGAPLDAGESRRVEAVARALDRLPAGAPVSAIFDALKLCVPVQAGLLTFIRPSAPEALLSQAVGVEAHVHETWLRTPPSLFAKSLAPLLSSGAGSLRRDSETIRGELRERLEVLPLLDTAGLGEGAGYKVMERTIPWYGTEHVMLALLMERRVPVPTRSDVMLAALNPALQRALLHVSLPFLAPSSIFPKMVAKDALGYLCVSPTGSLTATNLRALHLVDRYAGAAGIGGGRGITEAFARRAMERTRTAGPWQIAHDDSTSILHVHTYEIDDEAQPPSEGAVLVHMEELPTPPLSAKASCARALLTPAQLKVADLYVTTGAGNKDIALLLGKSPRTVSTQMHDICKRLGVGGRGEIAALIGRPRRG